MGSRNEWDANERKLYRARRAIEALSTEQRQRLHEELGAQLGRQRQASIADQSSNLYTQAQFNDALRRQAIATANQAEAIYQRQLDRVLGYQKALNSLQVTMVVVDGLAAMTLHHPSLRDTAFDGPKQSENKLVEISPNDDADIRKQAIGLDKQLNDAFLELTGYWQVMDAAAGAESSMPPELGTAVARRVRGIQRIAKGIDNGEFLRSVAKEQAGPSMKLLFERIAKLSFPNRPPGMTPWRFMLAQEWANLRRQQPEPLPAKIKQTLLEKWGTYTKITEGDKVTQEWRPRAGLTDDEEEAFDSLKKVKGKNAADYGKKLLDAAGITEFND